MFWIVETANFGHTLFMPKNTWFFVALFSTFLALGFFGFKTHQKSRENTQLQTRLQTQIQQDLAQMAQLRNELNTFKGQVDDLQKERDAVAQTRTDLEKQMRNALESKDITISQLQGKLTVNILDRVLFDSGEAVLKPEGEQVMQKIAQILAQHPKKQIHVIGHTDNVPIKSSARNRFPSNWELSTSRATAAVRFLCENAGVDPRQIGAVGYGEHRPIADNSTPEGRAKNRRIAIVFLSDELAGADNVPTVVSAINTNSAPATVPSSSTNEISNTTNSMMEPEKEDQPRVIPLAPDALSTNLVPVRGTNL
jgi:flagellar motor protein MotB